MSLGACLDLIDPVFHLPYLCSPTAFSPLFCDMIVQCGPIKFPKPQGQLRGCAFVHLKPRKSMLSPDGSGQHPPSKATHSQLICGSTQGSGLCARRPFRQRNGPKFQLWQSQYGILLNPSASCTLKYWKTRVTHQDSAKHPVSNASKQFRR